jgi:hypothetical protein
LDFYFLLNIGASLHVLQWGTAGLEPLVMGFIGIFFPFGVIHHSIASPHPRQVASLSKMYLANFISSKVRGNAIVYQPSSSTAGVDGKYTFGFSSSTGSASMFSSVGDDAAVLVGLTVSDDG